MFLLFLYLCMQPDFKAIKKRIEDLITRDYLERDKDNASMYKYLAWSIFCDFGKGMPTTCLSLFCPTGRQWWVSKGQLVSNHGIIHACMLLLLLMLFAVGLFGSSIRTPILSLYILYLKMRLWVGASNTK